MPLEHCVPEWSNDKRKHRMNKIAHGIVLALFGVACWLVWALLQLPRMVRLHGVQLSLPAFTRFCMALGPSIIMGLATLATGYCIWVWARKAEARCSWVGFLATATGSLFLITLPIVLAIYLEPVPKVGLFLVEPGGIVIARVR